MSYFRNFGNVVSAQLFTKPNNILLRPCNLPKVLNESTDPSVNHLHSVKALIQTISALKNYHQSTQGSYKQQIQSELSYLEKCKQQYQIAIKKYVQSNGSLTAEGIANVYTVAEELGFNSNWLERYLHNQIPNKAKFMSRGNIEELLHSVNKYHSNSPHVSILQKYLSEKSTDQIDYVTRIGNEVNQFEYCEKTSSNHSLVYALQNQSPYPAFLARKWLAIVWGRTLTYLAEPVRYNLHEN